MLLKERKSAVQWKVAIYLPQTEGFFIRIFFSVLQNNIAKNLLIVTLPLHYSLSKFTFYFLWKL